MSKFFKRAAICFLLLSFVLAMAACKKNGFGQTTEAALKENYIGVWKISNVEDFKSIIDNPSENVNLYFSLKEDGSLTAVDDEIHGENSKWEFKEDHIDILNFDGETLTGKIEDGKLVIEGKYNGKDAKLTFEKFTGELPNPKPKYTGTWELISVETPERTISSSLSYWGLDMTLEIKEGGDVTVYAAGGGPENATWKEKENGDIEIDVYGDIMTGKIKDGKLFMELEIAGMPVKTTFEKK